MGGCSLDGDVDCFDKVLLGPKWFKLFLSKERVLLRLGLSWDFWSKVFQIAQVKGKGFNQIWITLEMVQVALVKEKSMSKIRLTWGNGKFWLLDNVSLDVNRE